MDGYASNDPIEVEGFPLQPDEGPPLRRFVWVGGEYFETLGNTLIAGRALTRADANEQAMVAVVTENFAREYWPDARSAVGKRIRNYQGAQGDGPWREIVGVVGNVHDDGMSQDPPSIVYWPRIQRDFWGNEIQLHRSMAFAVRSAGVPPTDLLAQVREAVWSVNPNVPIARVRTLDEYVERSMARTSFTLIMLGIAAFVALFLGSVGIYGVISYAVSQRTREIGVRMAMGAEQSNVRAMVLRQAGLLAAGGVLIGLGGAAALTRLMTSLLYGVSPTDPVTLGSVAVGLTVVALVASYVPARRASKVDPVVALRFE
jgi:predicted permease